MKFFKWLGIYLTFEQLQSKNLAEKRNPSTALYGKWSCEHFRNTASCSITELTSSFIFRECDLEELLTLQTTQVPSRGKSGGFQGVLKCMPNVSASSCFRCPVSRQNKKGLKVSQFSWSTGFFLVYAITAKRPIVWGILYYTCFSLSLSSTALQLLIFDNKMFFCMLILLVLLLHAQDISYYCSLKPNILIFNDDNNQIS